MLAAALGILPLVRGPDYDFWWHLRTGELIFDSGIPSRDPFSWTAAGQSWTTHEWLAEVIIYGVQHTLGFAGNVILVDLAAFAALAFVYSLARGSGAGSKPLVLLILLASLMVSLFLTVRPQVFTWLLFAVFLTMLQRHYRGDSVNLWLLPPLMALWVNLHLGFVFGLMLVSLWVIAVVFDRVRGAARDLRVPVLVLAACLLATLLNPDGYHILEYPFRYLQDRESLQFIQEWRRPDLLSPLMIPLNIGLGLVALTLLSRDRPSPFLLLVTLTTVALSLQAIRNIPLLALVLPAVVAPALTRWAWARAERDSRTLISIFVAAALLALPVVLFAAAQGATGSLSLWSPSEDEFPRAGAAYLDQNASDRRLFNDYNWGGYLVYKLFPDAPVFIDGRSDLYREQLLLDYIKISRAEEGWQEAIDKYRIEVVIVHRRSSLAAGLLNDGDWRQVYDGPIERVFEHR